MSNAEIESRFPALNGGVVTERHARTCREQGHATHTVDGKDTGVCPRCGEVTEPAPTEYGAGWSLESGPADIPPPPYKLCRECRGWGVVTITHPGGLMSTEDCARCAGTGEES